MIKQMLFLSLLAASHFAAASSEGSSQHADLAKGKQIAEQVCAACHGADGNSMIATNPKLAGQHETYLLKQLHNFKAQNGKPAERNNPVMGGMVANLSDEDMRNVAAYFSQQTLKPKPAQNDSTLEFGRKLWRAGDASKGLPACAGCHGPAGAGLPAQYPRLQGQSAAYTEAQLKAFRAQERSNDPNKMMRTIAVKMTDPEIKALANYIEGLR